MLSKLWKKTSELLCPYRAGTLDSVSFEQKTKQRRNSDIRQLEITNDILNKMESHAREIIEANFANDVEFFRQRSTVDQRSIEDEQRLLMYRRIRLYRALDKIAFFPHLKDEINRDIINVEQVVSLSLSIVDHWENHCIHNEDAVTKKAFDTNRVLERQTIAALSLRRLGHPAYQKFIKSDLPAKTTRPSI